MDGDFVLDLEDVNDSVEHAEVMSLSFPKFNKALVLDKEPVAARLNSKGVIAMQADWTRPDPEITAFLQRFMRYGVPFNVVLGPKTPDGKTFPELLTRDAVLSALDTAASKTVAEK